MGEVHNVPIEHVFVGLGNLTTRGPFPQQAVGYLVYSLMGQKVASLFKGQILAGENKFVWDTNGIPSGVYFVRLETGENKQTTEITLLK